MKWRQGVIPHTPPHPTQSRVSCVPDPTGSLPSLREGAEGKAASGLPRASPTIHLEPIRMGGRSDRDRGWHMGRQLRPHLCICTMYVGLCLSDSTDPNLQKLPLR